MIRKCVSRDRHDAIQVFCYDLFVLSLSFVLNMFKLSLSDTSEI